MKNINHYILLLTIFCTSLSVQAFEFKDVLGTPAITAVSIQPLGSHLHHADINDFMYVGVNYNTYTFSTFSNSYGDRSFFLGVKRHWVSNETYDIGFALGAIHGYDGKLAELEQIPQFLRESYLVKGPVNPLIGLLGNYHLSDTVSFSVTVLPLVVLYGFEIKF